MLATSVSQIVGGEAGFLGDAGQHPGADLFAVVEGEHEIGPAGAGQGQVGALPFPFGRPAQAFQGGPEALGLNGRPLAH